LQRENPTNQQLGGLIGLLCGDAVGVPYEFHPAEEIPEKSLIDMVPTSAISS
jgi:ADP-ribosylglycohydrolase